MIKELRVRLEAHPDDIKFAVRALEDVLFEWNGVILESKTVTSDKEIATGNYVHSDGYIYLRKPSDKGNS